MATITTNKSLTTHLLRRAVFGGTKEEIDALNSFEYDHIVDYLLDNKHEDPVPIDLLRRYQMEFSDVRTVPTSGSYWMYRMANSKFPFEENGSKTPLRLLFFEIISSGENLLSNL